MAKNVVGIDKAIANINKKLARVGDVSYGGLLAGGAVVLRDAQLHVPVEYGTLRQSGYVRKGQRSTRQDPSVEVGFTASYAIYVHENLQAKWRGQPRKSGRGVYWGPQGEPRFLANALQRNQEEVLELVANHARDGVRR